MSSVPKGSVRENQVAIVSNNKDDSLKSVYISHNGGESKVLEKEYEPYDHRSVKRPTNYFETLIHLMKCSMGTGILAMPSAFSNAGWLAGIIGTVLMGLLCTYGVHILIASEYVLCKKNKKPSMLYPETAEAAILAGPDKIKRFSKVAPVMCNTFLLMYEIGSCSVYILFVCTNLKDVVDQYQSPEDQWDIRYYCSFLLIPFIMINSIRNYKFLAPLSTVATVLTIISFATIFYFLFSEIPEISNRDAVASLEKMPLFFGTVVFAIEAIGVVFPLENEMSNPKQFRGLFGVLNCAMLPIVILYSLVGLFGYLRYGQDVKGSITLSLPPTMLFSQAARLMLSVAIFITHALLLHPAIDIIWYEYLKPSVKQKHMMWEYITRVLTVFLTCGLAVIVPYLDLFISLIGSVCLSMLGLMFPAIIQTFTFWNEYKGVYFFLFIVKNIFICLIAIYGLLFGLVTSVGGIIEKVN